MKKILVLLLSVITLFASTVSLSGCLTMEKLNELSLEVERYDDSVVIVGIERVYDSNLKIPETIFGLPVTRIAGSAFNECKEIESVSIPKTVKVIGNNAFAKCTSLKKVVFEGKSQLKTIKGKAFNGCGSLRKIKIPESVVEMEKFVFANSGVEKIYCETKDLPVGWEFGWNFAGGYYGKIEAVVGYKGFIGDIRMWLGL